MDNFASLTKDCDVLGVVKSIEDDYMLIDTLVQGCKQCVGEFISAVLNLLEKLHVLGISYRFMPFFVYLNRYLGVFACFFSDLDFLACNII